jgi:hypothetical protein
MQARKGGAAEEEIAENTQNYNRKGVLLQHYYSWCLLCFGIPRRFSADRATSGKATSCGNCTHRGGIEPISWTSTRIGQSVRAPSVNSQPVDNMLRVVTIVQQIVTEFHGAVSGEDKIVAITNITLNIMNQNDNSISKHPVAYIKSHIYKPSLCTNIC